MRRRTVVGLARRRLEDELLERRKAVSDRAKQCDALRRRHHDRIEPQVLERRLAPDNVDEAARVRAVERLAGNLDAERWQEGRSQMPSVGKAKQMTKCTSLSCVCGVELLPLQYAFGVAAPPFSVEIGRGGQIPGKILTNFTFN